MWGNLAGRLGTTDLNATLQKIGNAVAPPPDDENANVYSDDDYDDDGGDYEEEDYDYEEEGNPQGFGLVGMFARALGDDGYGDDEGYDEYDEEYEEKEKQIEIGDPIHDSLKNGVVLNEKGKGLLPAEDLTRKGGEEKTDAVREERERTQAQREKKQQIEPIDFGKSSKQGKERMPEQRLRQHKKERPLQVENSAQIKEKVLLEERQKRLNQERVIPNGRQERESKKDLKKRTERVKEKKSEGSKAASALYEQMKRQSSVAESTDLRPKEASSTMQDRKEAQIGKAESNKHIEETGEGLFQPQRARNNHLRQGMIRTNSSVEEGKSGDQNLGKGPQIDMNYRKLEEKLKAAEHHITILEKQVTTEKNNSKASAEKIVLTFQEKESRLLQAAAEESQLEIFRIEQKLHSEIHSLEEKVAKLRRERLNEQEASRQTIEASDFRAEQAEKEFRSLVKKHENQLALAQQREKRALQMADDKVAQTMAMLDEREEEISRLKSVMRSLESSVDEHAEGEEEAEQEVVELQTENESLQEHVDDLEAKCSKLKAQVTNLEVEAEKFGGIQMELTMLREERDRERAKSQSVVESAITSYSQVESERDGARAEVRDLKQQLAATHADLEVAKTDKERIITANNNLQAALEAFQDERQAEMDILNSQRKEEEEAIASANAAALDATRQAHEAEIKQLQKVADNAVKNVMNEMNDLVIKLEEVRSENSQMRRSLDEAIHRLQTTQEDVIDRTLMKNILLDWCTMRDKEKRQQVLQLMASVLHFTEDEKEKVHLTHVDIDSVRAKVVGALAAPLPPSKADVEHLEGNNVREKWVNFLLAETEDGS